MKKTRLNHHSSGMLKNRINPEVRKTAMKPEQQERYVRWQDYRVTQLSFAINLFLGFAVASLAYAINLKLENRPHISIQIELVIIWWSLSAGLGCFATVSKLLDYRYTARAIKNGGSFNSFMSKCCGPVTWGAFWAQIISYSVGAYLFIAGVLHA
jgi:hypothetical protein